MNNDSFGPMVWRTATCLPLLALGGCLGKNDPAAPEAARPTAVSRVVMTWRTPSVGLPAALLDPEQGPVSRLVDSPEAGRLVPIDRALRVLDTARPVEVPESAQAGVVRLTVSAALAGVAEGAAARRALEGALADARAFLRPGLSGEGLAPEGESRAWGLALEHRAELFRQLAGAFREASVVPCGAVLAQGPAVAAAHARLAASCDGLAAELDQAGRSLRTSGAAGRAASNAVPVRPVLKAFGSEWRSRAVALPAFLAGGDPGPAGPAACPPAETREQAARLTSTIRAVRDTWVQRWEDELRGHPLADSLVAACRADLADLRALARECSRRASVMELPAWIRTACREVGEEATGAIRALSREIAEPETGRGTPGGADPVDVAESGPRRTGRWVEKGDGRNR